MFASIQEIPAWHSISTVETIAWDKASKGWRFCWVCELLGVGLIGARYGKVDEFILGQHGRHIRKAPSHRFALVFSNGPVLVVRIRSY